MLTQKKRKYAQAREQGKGIQDAAYFAGVEIKACAKQGSALEKDKDVIAYRERLRSGEEKISEPGPAEATHQTRCPMQFLEGIMADPAQDPKLRLDAAKSLLPYKFRRLGDVGKKEQAAEDAQKISKFKPRVINNK